MIINNKNIVCKTLDLLQESKKWQEIYRRYAEELICNEFCYVNARKQFHLPSPFACYSKLTDVKSDGKNKIFDLRFAGQSIGEIVVDSKNNEKKGNVSLRFTDKQKKFAKGLGLNVTDNTNNLNWRGKESKEFRVFISNLTSSINIPIASPEHRIESLILEELNKQGTSDGKKLRYMAPVKLGGQYFQLTTPLKASTHNPCLAIRKFGKDSWGAVGGGIDILARVVHKDGSHRLAIIELKDENKKGEPQPEVMVQALIYATFIGSLLRTNNCGNSWYKILISDDNPKNVEDMSIKPDLDVISLMPEGELPDGDLKSIPIDKLGITLHLYTMYYKVDDNGNPSDFTGTLFEDIKK